MFLCQEKNQIKIVQVGFFLQNLTTKIRLLFVEKKSHIFNNENHHGSIKSVGREVGREK